MSTTCHNCGALVKSKYCPECGQKADIGRINMHALLHEFWHGFTHTDKGVLRLWLDLLLRPRRTYENYFSGHRKHYFSPVVFFLVTFGIYIYVDQKVFDYQDHIRFLEIGRPFQDDYGRYMQEHVKVIALIMLPIQSILCWAVFFRRRNLAECIVFWLFCIGFINTLQILATPIRLYYIKDKETVDFFLNLLAILVMVIHAIAVFGNKWSNGVIAILLIFALSLIDFYWHYYFQIRLALTYGPVRYPDLWQAIQMVYGDLDVSIYGNKAQFHPRFGWMPHPTK